MGRLERIEQRRREVYPLELLPEEKRTEIEQLASRDRPPQRWLKFELCQLPSRAWYEWHWARGIDPDSRRDSIPRAVRQAVIDRDGDTCQICFHPVEPGDMHLDHIKPWSKGGANAVANLRVTHSTCNLRKGAKDSG